MEHHKNIIFLTRKNIDFSKITTFFENVDHMVIVTINYDNEYS